MTDRDDPQTPTRVDPPVTDAVSDRLRRLEWKVNAVLVIAALSLLWPLVSAVLGVVWWVVGIFAVLAVIAVLYAVFRDRLPAGVRRTVDGAARRGFTRMRTSATGSTAESAAR